MNIQQSQFNSYEEGVMDCLFSNQPKEDAGEEYLEGYGRQYEEEARENRYEYN